MKRYISILVGCLFLLSYHVNADNFLQDLDNEESDDNWENSDNTNEETFLDDDALPDDENWKVSDADEQEKDNPNDFKENLDENWKVNDADEQEKDNPNDFKENLDENWKVNDADEQEKDNPNDFKENLEEELDLETRNIGAPIRLVNGGAPNRGRVEVYHNGSWGTVCDDHWDILDAKVVCRQLGFPGATLAPCCARFGQGSNRTWMDDVQCTGSERYLSQCRFRGWGREDCSHSEDAGVVCSNPVTQTPPLSSIAPSASTPPPQVSSSVPIVPSVSSTSIPAVATSVAPVYTTRRPLYTTRRPWYTTRRPWYTTRRPWYTTRRPWFTTRRPWFPTRRPWYTTRRPWFPTRRPWYPTRRPWFTTRRPWYPTRRPSRRRPRLNILRILIKMIKGITILLDGIKDGIKAGISRAGARQYKRELVSMLGQLEGKADAIKDSSDETEIILLKDLGQVRERAHVLMKQLDEVPDDKEGQ